MQPAAGAYVCAGLNALSGIDFVCIGSSIATLLRPGRLTLLLLIEPYDLRSFLSSCFYEPFTPYLCLHGKL